MTELDGHGKIMHEWKAPNVSAASPLPNGHVLIATAATRGVSTNWMARANRLATKGRTTPLRGGAESLVV